MVVNALYYVMTIFITIAIFLFLQEPYYMQLTKDDMKIAQIQMENVKDYEINSDKITRITQAKESIKYKNKDVLKGVHVLSFEKDFIYDVKSDEADFESNVLTLRKNVHIIRNDDTIFKSQKISYDKEKKIFFSDASFDIKNPLYHIEGGGFTYDLDKKRIIANMVRADYKLEKK